MKKIQKIVAAILMTLMVLPLSVVLPQVASAIGPTWSVSGNYVAAFNYQGTDYPHDMVLAQDNSGNVTGSGGSPAGANTYMWAIDSGSVSDNTIHLTAHYTATADAVTPPTTFNITGTIGQDGTISGTWSDNYQGGDRTGTWHTTTGTASQLMGTLAAEDFGVMDQSNVKGYTAGFGLTDATFAGAQSVVVKLYSDTTLLQTNTLGGPNAASITGNQISSPFDVFSTFDYPADGYWMNARQAEYGQTLIPTKVIATVTLSNGKVVTAENDNLAGDPSTIFPTNPSMVKVTIEKYIDGVQATATSAQSMDFPMTATWNAQNIGAGTGPFALSASGFGGNTTPYEAITADMTPGADYSATENTGGSVVGASCSSGQPFALQGYSSGNTLSAAQQAPITMDASTLTNITSDKFIIVRNISCNGGSGQIGGDVIQGNGVLHVDSVTTVNSSATADGTFASGWKYVFHITAPTNEPNLAMKFSNWLSGANTIPVANNMRISSAQANNSGATVLLTAANTYSSPALTMTGDLDPNVAGRQVDVMVEVAVPVGTATGSYTTSYGVLTNP